MLTDVLDTLLDDNKDKKVYALMLFYSAFYLGIVESRADDYFILKDTLYFDNASMALNAYSNTRCPASQLIEGKNKEELEKNIEEMKKNYQSKKWLDENLYPYL